MVKSEVENAVNKMEYIRSGYVAVLPFAICCCIIKFYYWSWQKNRIHKVRGLCDAFRPPHNVTVTGSFEWILQHLLNGHKLLKCSWARHSIHHQDVKPYKSITRPASLHKRSSHHSTLPHFHLNCHRLMDCLFTGMMSCSLHLDGFYFIATMTFPHQSEKSKPFRSSLLPPSSPPWKRCRGEEGPSSRETVTGNGKIISKMSLFGFESSSSLVFVWNRTLFSCFPV